MQFSANEEFINILNAQESIFQGYRKMKKVYMYVIQRHNMAVKIEINSNKKKTNDTLNCNLV